MPTPEAIQKCQHVFLAFGPELIESVKADLNPYKICNLVELCNDKNPDEDNQEDEATEATTPAPIQSIISKPPATSATSERSPQTDIKCPRCEVIMNELYRMVDQQADRSDIHAVLNSLCLNVPPALRHDCTNIIGRFSQNITEMVLEKMTAQQVNIYFNGVFVCNCFLFVTDLQQNPVLFPCSGNGGGV